MKNRLIKISILFFEAVLLLVLLKFNVGCFFLKNFCIRCPGCGLTRAFISIFNLDFISAFKYNVISIPLFVFIFIANVVIIYDVIFNKNMVISFLKQFSKYYKFILILLIIVTIINNFNKI